MKRDSTGRNRPLFLYVLSFLALTTTVYPFPLPYSIRPNNYQLLGYINVYRIHIRVNVSMRWKLLRRNQEGRCPVDQRNIAEICPFRHLGCAVR
ncbi:hypothetical protein B0T13DRAFT_5804 [Neurospora crassa]|nr:hypothetical protein B0T13DRAFT_5804 [Neurospora crassa]